MDWIVIQICTYWYYLPTNSNWFMSCKSKVISINSQSFSTDFITKSSEIPVVKQNNCRKKIALLKLCLDVNIRILRKFNTVKRIKIELNRKSCFKCFSHLIDTPYSYGMLMSGIAKISILNKTLLLTNSVFIDFSE